MADFRYVVCDVFTDRPLEGNQLAVFTDARALDGETMQALAREINYSESTFVLTQRKAGTRRCESSLRPKSCLSPDIRRWGQRSC